MYLRSIIIKRAVPGSGKSTISKCILKAVNKIGLSVTIHSTDSYFVNKVRRYDFRPEKLEEFHKRNLSAFIDDLKKGLIW